MTGVLDERQLRAYFWAYWKNVIDLRLRNHQKIGEETTRVWRALCTEVTLATEVTVTVSSRPEQEDDKHIGGM